MASTRQSLRGPRRALAAAVLTLGPAASAPAAPARSPPEDVAAMVELGRRIFFDPDLSDPAGTSCSSCHDPARAFSGQHGSKLGVPRGSRPGHFARRASPSLLYLKYVPSFRFHQDGDDPGVEPYGGFFWDGRVDTLRALARQPLLNPDEMNNRDGAAVAARIARAPYAADFARLTGAAPGAAEATLGGVGRALEAYLTTDAMAPFSSRFDAFVRGQGTLTAQEQRGLALFQDPLKGGCNGCHVVAVQSHDPSASLFTDYGFEAVGAPRNPRLKRHAPDLGLCERRDSQTPSNDPAWCISFRTPSLRNVATRTSFMHNGTFTRLRDVVAFYATRDTDPRRWYPAGVKFGDAPAGYRGHVNSAVAPYNGRRPGDPPALDDDEIDAIVAFLRTLTDAAYATTASR